MASSLRGAQAANAMAMVRVSRDFETEAARRDMRALQSGGAEILFRTKAGSKLENGSQRAASRG